ncbi:uncharacterized protein LOC118179744 isoform X2 [Stegodyphus dumicola]|uniref:uncharacterized protein LOC118179744 isoform X2 n=1 Tax=Stegodyphus dumicola TaxID=202533 RepID=UPI0015B08944|nr:uncharacterized protein LOC118179744 isoform X2 [Stegodyphus dumicola]
MLTMALIGCLPDNVQQAIKSFSIRPGKQHITFAFPFMEETLRTFCETDSINEAHIDTANKNRLASPTSSVLFFDECLEVVHGFQTYVTILPQLNKSSLPVVMLTLYQRDTTEGICRHFQSLIRTLVEHKVTQDFWKLPLMVAELSSKYKEMILDICAETINEIQTENLSHTFPGKSPEQTIQLVKEKILRPCLVSYPEFLRRHTQEVMRNLTATDPSYFLSLVELLQSTTCSILDYKKVDMMFKSPGIDPVIREMWRVWGHEQISRKVFPVTMAASTPVTKLGPLYGHLPGVSDTGPEAVVSVGTLSHVPVKEGLQSVIKCLKSQDISQIKLRSTDHDSKFHSCNCSVCKIQPQTRRNSRLRLYGDISKQTGTTSDCSAFHLPLQKRQSSVTSSGDFCSRTSVSSFRLQSSVSSLSYHPRHHHHHNTFLPSPVDSNSRNQHADYHQTFDIASTDGSSHHDRSAYGSMSSSGHVIQPVPHYLPINLKAFSQRMLYGYPMLNKPQYPLSIPARPTH